MACRAVSTILLCALAFLPLAIPAFLAPNVNTPDWPAFYAGGCLAGSPGLYSFTESRRITRQFMPSRYAWAFLRPPAYAAAVAPLRLLKPSAAFAAWQLLAVAAVIASVLILWRDPLAAVASSLPPVWSALRQGQDAPLLLLCCALSITFAARGAPFWAGAVLSVAAIKPHLLLLLPVLVLSRRAVRFTAGFATGAAVWLGLSFAAGGRAWLKEYSTLVAENELKLERSMVAKPWSLITAVPELWWALLIAALAVGACYFASRRLTAPHALAACLALCPLVAPRAYMYDYTLALPAVILAVRSWMECGRTLGPDGC